MISAACLAIAAACDHSKEPVAPGQRQPITLSLAAQPADTLDQRGFGVVVNVNLAVAKPQLVLDPGTPAERVAKDFVTDDAEPYTGATALGDSAALLEILDTLTRGRHTFVVHTYDQLGLRPEAISGSFVAKLDQVAYHVIPLSGIGGADAAALRLNDAGVAVGWAKSADTASHAVVWRNGAPTVLAPDNATFASDINAKGQIVGCTSSPSPQSVAGNPYQVSVVWTGDVPLLLTQPCANTYFGVPRMNDSGAIAFSYTMQGTLQAPFPTSTILWPDGSSTQIPVTTVDGINSSGEVVGNISQSFDANHGSPFAASWPAKFAAEARHRGYYYSNASFTAVNDANQAIGFDTEKDATEVFLSSNGAVKDLTWDLGTATKSPTMVAVNSHGVVLAFDSASHGILLWNQHTSAVTLDDPSWHIDGVSALNANGWITAHAKDPVTGQGTALLLVPK